MMRNQPHHPECHCYGVAFLMGFTDAIRIANQSTGDEAKFWMCSACGAMLEDLMRKAGAGEIQVARAPKVAVDVH